MTFTHYAFADESSYTTDNNYGAISILNFRKEIKTPLEDAILPLLADIPNEYKWSNFQNPCYLNVSKNVFDILFQYAGQGDLRIDTIIWDNKDAAHKRNLTNTGEKLSILYYIRLRDMLANRWGSNTRWMILVDEQRQINWEELKQYLQYYSMVKNQKTLLGMDYDLAWHREHRCLFSIEDLTPVKSCDNHFIQIADLFAGMAAYSHNYSDQILTWLDSDSRRHYENNIAQPAFEFLEELKLDPKYIHRNKFIKYVYLKCKKRKYGVSIRNKKGLHTFQPKHPFNFFYAGPEK